MNETLGGRLSVVSAGGGQAAGVNFAGGIALMQDKVRDTAISFDTGHNGNDFISAPIADDTGSAGNPLRLRTTNRAVVLGAGNSTYANGTLVESGANTITLSASARLGSGHVTVNSGGLLVLKHLAPLGTECSLASGATLDIADGAVVASGLASATKNGACTNGSALVFFSGTVGTADLFVGQTVSGTGIPASTVVQSIDGFQRITLSQVATVTGTTALTFGGHIVNVTSRFTGNSAGIYGLAGGTHIYDINHATLGNGMMAISSPAGMIGYKGVISPAIGQNTIAVGGGASAAPTVPDGATSTGSFMPSPPWGNGIRLTEENGIRGTNNLDVGVRSGVNAIYGTAVLMTNNSYSAVTRVYKGAGLAIGYKGGTPLGSSSYIVVEKGGYFGPAGLGSMVDSRINAHYTNLLFQAGSYLTFFCAIDNQNGQLAFNYDAFGDTETVRLDDTSFMIGMNTSLKPIETLGSLYVKGQGRWVRGSCGGTPSVDYTAAALVMNDPYAVFDSCNADGSKAKLKFSDTAAVALTNGLCTPWIQADSGLASYDLNGLRPVTNGFVAFAAAGVSDIARITANTDVTADKSVYALRVDAVDVTGTGKTISILSGGFHTFSGGKKSWVNYAFPNTLAYCMMVNASDNTGNFIAPHGLLKTGKGDLRLYGSGNVISNILAVYGANVVLKSSQAASEVAYLTNCVVRLGVYGGLNVNGANSVAVKGLEGSGTVSGATTAKPVTILRTLKPGSETAPGTLTASAGKLVMGSACVSRFRLGYLSDKVVVNGDMTVAGTVNIEAAAGVTPGRYALATANGGTMDGSVTRGSTPDGYAVRLAVEGNTL